MAVWFWYFLLYSFGGFLLEVLFARLIRSPNRARKCFLFLPLCPVYGLGALLILLLPPYIRYDPIRLFFFGALTATAAEYAVALFYEYAAGVKFWDYHDLPLNLQGRVCLLFSFFWGLLSLPLCGLVQPLAASLCAAIPPILLPPAVLLVLLDGGASLYLLRREKSVKILRWYRRFLPAPQEP